MDTEDEAKAPIIPGEEEKPSLNKKPSCLTCPKCYQSDDPENRVTPFAIILLIVLFLIYVLNQADRLVLPVSIPAGLRCDLSVTSQCNKTNLTGYTPPGELEEGLINITNSSDDCIHFNDEQQGLLTGPAFTVIYVVAGLPLARLADTRSRSLVLILGLVFWSAMVLLTGFVHEFWQLILLRVLLGVGEASCNPVAYSLVADFFPAYHRAFALSFYHYGVYLGGALGWMSGALNVVLDWRWTFRILGMAGLVMAPITIIALWEPKTVRERRLKRRKGKRVYSIKEVVLFLVKCPPYWMLLVAGSIRNIPGYALGAWLPTFFSRQYGVEASHYAIPVGLVVLCGGGAGSFIGGFLSDRLSSRWGNAKAFVIAGAQLLAAPCIVGVLLAPTPTVSYGLLFLAYLTAETWLGPAAAIVQDICMPAMRSQGSAIYIGVITIIASLGPVLVPAFTDHIPAFDPCSVGVGYALLVIVPLFYVTSSALFVVLGVVIYFWRKRTASENITYSVLTGDKPSDDESEKEK